MLLCTRVIMHQIPKFTRHKMEVSTKSEYNPIKQDIKKGKVRYYHGPLYWNYGCLPQTWEDPNVKHPMVDCHGDKYDACSSLRFVMSC